MAEASQTESEALRRYLASPKLSACTCPYEWKSYGRLYGISMGKGWVRMDTHPACPAHRPPTH